ncbi:serine/threonine-protein phosphatase [Planosporangium flavigriseum]|uniref:PPM-type phosphatase domain-containing protein n=1 Tax=Planosporangium flavigriseum TaxID=373681 RepID=A0A8J3LM75_9ACTN|nr:PP2C family protein-serine/threonine phosphatase [Planosporangium flavigriseum]NJC66298.1 serine/threonine-protein phosphatase [Planosporangium flavigriseum]GIG75312.1 hypothetical protein Pfl04_37160 [Planosporangium flavigriseum]
MDGVEHQRDELTERIADGMSRITELDQAHQAMAARYAQLSHELAETNRGVVALYAELDEQSRRLAALAETTLEVNQAATYGDLLEAAVAGAARMFGAPALASACRPDGARLVAVARADGAPPSAGPWTGPPPPGIANTKVGAVIRSELAARWATLLPDLPGEAVSVAAVRVRETRPPGFIAVGVSDLDGDDAHVLRQLAQAMALAIEAMRVHDEERQVALTVQRSLLPRELPETPGFDVSVRYVPASSQAEIGGDFYELAMIDGQLVVAIGDVVGHSLHAATVMGELRHALRAYVIEGHGPAAVLWQLNRLMVRLLPDEIATVCLLTVDQGTGRVRAANGGHLPPLVIFDGKAQPVEVAGPLLGVEVDRPDDVVFDLPSGAILVLLTDGLVERYDRSFDAGLGLVLDAATAVADDLEAFADRLLAAADAETSEDDIALVVLRRR